MVPLLPRIEAWTKFEEGRSRRSPVIDRIVWANLTTVTLTFDPVTPQSNKFLCYPRWMWGQDMRKVGQGVLMSFIGNNFGTLDPVDLDLWCSDPNRVPQPPKMDEWTTFEEGSSRRSYVIHLKQIWHIWPRWPWPLTPKSIAFLCYQWPMCGTSLRRVGQGVSRYWSETKRL
mgnify:CR=1 FL=1